MEQDHKMAKLIGWEMTIDEEVFLLFGLVLFWQPWRIQNFDRDIKIPFLDILKQSMGLITCGNWTVNMIKT